MDRTRFKRGHKLCWLISALVHHCACRFADRPWQGCVGPWQQVTIDNGGVWLDAALWLRRTLGLLRYTWRTMAWRIAADGGPSERIAVPLGRCMRHVYLTPRTSSHRATFSSPKSCSVEAMAESTRNLQEVDQTASKPAETSTGDEAPSDSQETAIFSPATSALGSATMDSLPEELFCEILTHLPARQRMEATHVCRRWRNVALAHPHVWQLTSVASEDCLPYALAKAFMERSKGLPTSLALHIRTISRFGVAASMLQTVVQEMSRLRHLHLFIPPDISDKLLLKALQTNAPMLESLYVCRPAPQLLREIWAPFGGNMEADPQPTVDFEGVPKLKSVTLLWIPLPYLPKGPTELRSLTLLFCPSIMTHLLDLLKRSPKLTHLEIMNEGEEARLTADLVEKMIMQGRVRLPSLRSLSGFYLSSPMFIRFFLSRLIITKKTKLSLTAVVAEDSRDRYLNLLPADFPPLQTVRRLELISLPLSYVVIHAYKTAKPCRFPSLKAIARTTGVFEDGKGILYNWPFRTDLVQELVLCGLAPSEVSVDQPQLVLTGDNWVAMLRKLPALRVVRLMSLDEETLESFGQALQADATLCPELIRVEVSDTNPGGKASWNKLEESLSGRKACVGGRLVALRFFAVPENWTGRELRVKASRFTEIHL
ncbi:hypothetical protein FKP32DRAFT_1417719 [Trametes sanguinea]|nr:hypothetical protein FKP32DRAFT_1417719 [Trametes sanguinea]